jgi:hypothetical protein
VFLCYKLVTLGGNTQNVNFSWNSRGYERDRLSLACLPFYRKFRNLKVNHFVLSVISYIITEEISSCISSLPPVIYYHFFFSSLVYFCPPPSPSYWCSGATVKWRVAKWSTWWVQTKAGEPFFLIFIFQKITTRILMRIFEHESGVLNFASPLLIITIVILYFTNMYYKTILGECE